MSIAHPTVNRRRLGATLLGLLALTTIRTDRRVASDDFDFAAWLLDPESAAAVGAAYLRRYPENASRAALLGFLQLPDEPLTASQIAAALERRIRSDFELQRTVVLERWLLAHTEAALCGLIALD